MAGHEPIVDSMILTRGEPFVHYFPCTPADPFPPGTTAVFRVRTRDAGDTFMLFPAALVEPGGIQIQLDATDADVIPEGYRFQLSVKVPDYPSTCWQRGPIWRKD